MYVAESMLLNRSLWFTWSSLSFHWSGKRSKDCFRKIFSPAATTTVPSSFTPVLHPTPTHLCPFLNLHLMSMAFLEKIFQFIPSIWTALCQHFGHVQEVNTNVDDLMSETSALKRKRGEYQEEVEAAESVGRKRRRRVDDWFCDVDKIAAEVDSLKTEFQNGRLTINPFWWHKFGQAVVEKRNEVRRIQDRGSFDEVAEDWPGRPPRKEVPEQLEQQSTSMATLNEISQALWDEEKGIVCVYGMGGIGKTSLMKALYNRLIEEDEEENSEKKFDQVIWVRVSSDFNLQAIQRKIGNKLKVEFHGNESMEEKRDILYARLRNLRYMLILDDLWQAFNLSQVGIPLPNKKNRCKIAITTRSLDVSRSMEADAEIKVKALTKEEAWDLFCSKTGDVVLLPEIQPLAEDVMEECGRLPLAIKTVGAAMRKKDKKNLWRNALRALRRSVPDVPDMERQVFLPLKLSYDYLEDPKIQVCFLHCSLFPEDHKIDPNDLVRYWAFEQGLIENVSTLDEASNKGYDILDRLKNASLLEVESRDLVRMHDLLRDLAIWITSPSSSSSSSSSEHQAAKFLVRAGEELVHPPEEKSWEGVERVSLMSNAIKELGIKPNCPNLVSLFLCENWQLNVIYSPFFQQMPKLGILDLGKTLIRSLPPSLSQLVSLRALILNKCTRLVYIPPLGALKELQLLDLSFSGIENLPEGIPSLVNLKQLDLSYTKALANIPCNFISALTSLEDLRLWGRFPMPVSVWREVVTLRHLTCLSINLSKLDEFSKDDLHHFHHHHRQWLSNLVQFRVCFGGCFFDACDPFTQTERDLRIWFCCNFPKGIEGLASHVQYLQVLHCQGPACISQIICSSKSLKTIDVTFSEGVKCIIDWQELDDHVNSLDCLEKLVIYSLPSLEKTFQGRPPLAAPTYSSQHLKEVYISKCPKLKTVFSCSMVYHLDQLRQLKVEDCEELEEIVQGETLPDNALQRLSSLKISSLPKLTRICRQLPVLNSLEAIRIESCPELKKLPILGSAITKIEGRIKGQREWWEGMEWGDGCHSKSIYYSVYREGLDRFGRGGRPLPRSMEMEEEEKEASDIEE